MSRPGIVLVAAVALAAAVLTVVWWGKQEPAAATTHVRAVKLFNAMETYTGATAMDQAREAARYGGVRILLAHDTAQGREIVLAVTATSGKRHNFELRFWPGDDQKHSATRCFRWTPEREWDTADEVRCPAQADG